MDQTREKVIVIGGGPMATLEALYLDSLGFQVQLVEKAGSLGGSWRSLDRVGYSGVELGCHAILPERGCYPFLAGIGIELVPLSPRALYDGGSFVAPFEAVRSSLHMHRSKAARAGRGVKTLPIGVLSRRYRALSEPLAYPLGGSAEILDRLGSLVERSSINVRLDLSIEHIASQPNGSFIAKASNSERLECDRVVLTSASDVRSFDIDNKTVSLSSDTETSYQLHVRLSGRLEKVSYLEFGADPSLWRLLNVSKYIPKNDQSDKSVLAVQLRHETISPDAMAGYLLRKLQNAGLASSSHSVEAAQLLQLELVNRRALPDPVMDLVGVSFLKSNGFGSCISTNAERWKPLLDRSGP